MLTRKASLILGAGVVLLVVGVATRSTAAALAGTVALAWVLLVFLLYRRPARLEARRSLEIERVFEGDRVEVKLALTNAGTRAVFFEARDALPRELRLEEGSNYLFAALGKGEATEIRYTLKCPLLGVYEIGPLALRLEDPFGLFYDEKTLPPADALWVLPRKEDLRKAALLSKLPMPLLGEHQVNQPGDGFDFFALRDYVPGDTMKTINWKASARSGKLMVNQLERMTAAEATVIYDNRAVTAAGSEEHSPRVIGARSAASITYWLHGKKDQVRFVYYNDDVHEIEPASAERQIPLILTTLAELRPRGALPLKVVVDDILPGLKMRTPVILISPCVDDPTIVESVSILLANQLLVTVISPRPMALPGLEREFELALLADRARTIQSLRGYGCYVVDLEPDVSLAATMEKGAVVA
ncbi:MAG: DUF58 domain-containing protein [Thermoplasmatota archaeon]